MTAGKCEGCESQLKPIILRHPEYGFYIGINCTCGESNERLSDYYERYQTADIHLHNETYRITDG